jgi:hypothetical protein
LVCLIGLGLTYIVYPVNHITAATSASAESRPSSSEDSSLV